MKASAVRVVKRTLLAFALVAVTLLAVRIYDTQRGPPLKPWHTYVPEELSVEELERTDWAGYLNVTFQSVMDFTVHTRAIVNALYAQLPANGSELVLFDVNRAALLSPLLRTATDTILSRILPEPPRKFRTTIITNAGAANREVVELRTDAGQVTESSRPLGLAYPLDVFSLSHVALPFPPGDALLRVSSNPFYAYVRERIGEQIDASSGPEVTAR